MSLLAKNMLSVEHTIPIYVNIKNGFKVFYTNCDCLTKSKINDLECSNQLINPSIICLTEVLPKNRKLEYNQEMYNLTVYVIVDSLLKGRGICLYCKPEFKYNVIKLFLSLKKLWHVSLLGRQKYFCW